MITYLVQVDDLGNKRWFCNGELHREDGHAVEYVNGEGYFYIKGKCLSEAEFNFRKNNLTQHAGNLIEIDGVKYRLTKVR